MRMLLQVLGLIAVPNFIVGARLPGCTSDRLAVNETSNTVITCDQFGAQDKVTWYLKPQSPQEDVLLGTCSPQVPCNQFSRYNLTRSSTQSTVTITPSSDIRSISSYMIRCDATKTTTCALDVFFQAEVPAENCRVDARSVPWTFNGSCNITKTFSSLNNYKCRVFRGTTQSSQTTLVKSENYTPRPHSDADYRTGSCSFSYDFTSLVSNITSRQDFYFRIDVYPGPTQRVTGPVTLQKPVTPTISCPDIVAENTTFTCTCSTTNLGQPAGRLAWSRVSGGTIIEGENDVTTLTLPSQTLTRHDQGVKFCCDVRWAAGSYMAVYTGNIGFPPSQTVLKVNSASPGQTVTVSENDDVSLTCTATGGNPESTLTLSDATSTSPLIHSLGKAQCQHSGDYTCIANNGYGRSVTSTRLYVKCSPRTTSQISPLNFIDEQVRTSFVVTAYPLPTLAFSYLGRSENNTGSPKNIPDSIKMNGICEVSGETVLCIITVYNVTSNEAAGIYQVTINNTEGNANDTFEVQYKGPVPQEPSSENAAVIGGVVGGSVVVAVIIAVILVVVWKRRKGPDRELSGSTAAGRPKNGQGRNSYREMDEPGLANADPEAPSRPLSFAPMAVYAKVDKNQKNSKAAASPGANGGQPADVYAQVDTTKKSNQGAAAPETEVNGGHPVDMYAVVENTKKKQASGAKPKTGAKAAGKPKKEKKKKDKRDESAHVYGNVKEIKQDKGAKAKKTTKPSKEETSSGKMVTPEGLIYTAVEFAQPPKSGKPAPKKPEEEPVVYSAVDFTKSPPAP